MRKFHIAEILSVTNDRYLCPGRNYTNMLNYLTGDSTYTNQVPRVLEECAHTILRRHPALADCDIDMVSFPPGTPEEVRVSVYDRWLAIQIEKFGEYVELAPIPGDDHRHLDPVEELSHQVGGKEVIVVENES